MYKKTKLVFGVGINDADYVIGRNKIVDGKKVRDWYCPFYNCWVDLIRRCYNTKSHVKHPTYAICTVCPDWIYFSNFKAWMENQDWQGKHLDKDLLVTGNKVYSPETCCFVSPEVNAFMTDRAALRGKYKIGVSWKNKVNKLQARCRNPFDNKSDYLGVFDCEEEAHQAWRKRKHLYACRYADMETNPRIADALRKRYA